MTGEEIIALREEYDEIGRAFVSQEDNGEMTFSVPYSRGPDEEIIPRLCRVWNEIGGLIREALDLARDNQRMRGALEAIQYDAVETLSATTARMSNPDDYWQAIEPRTKEHVKTFQATTK